MESESEFDRFIRSLIFDDASTDRDARHVDLALPYVHSLLQMDAEQLATEENSLEDSARNLQEQKAVLVQENYHVLLEIAKEIEALRLQMPTFQSDFKELSDKSTDASKIIKAAESSISDFVANRQNQIRLNSYIFQLEDLLGIPALMDALLKRNLFEEAIDVMQFMERIQKSSGGVDLLQPVISETRARSTVITNLLISQIRNGPVQLLQALKIVSLLRRLGQVTGAVMDERQIRISFLQARSSFINGLVAAISQRDPTFFLGKLLETCRVHFFDTLTFYWSVFPDGPDVAADLRSIPYLWIQTEVDCLCDTLRNRLPDVDPSKLDSTLRQLLSVADSLSRFGVNPSLRFFQIFSSNVFCRLQLDVANALKSFEKSLASGPLKATAITRLDSHSHHENGFSSPEIHPPHELLMYPPLAQLCNDYIKAINRLRSCYVGNLALPVLKEISQSLQRCQELIRVRTTSQDAKDLEETFETVLMPFLTKIRESICSFRDCTEFSGATATQLRSLLQSFEYVPHFQQVSGTVQV